MKTSGIKAVRPYRPPLTITFNDRLLGIYPSPLLLRYYGEGEKENRMSTISEKKLLSGQTPESVERRLALESVRKQMRTFAHQAQEYFDRVQADVENYKFIVEKHGEWVEVEVVFKAYIHPKAIEAANIIPK